MNVLALAVSLLVSSFSTENLINWKVGDEADFNISMGFLGKGTMHKFVAKDEGEALWVTQDMNIMNQRQKVEVLIRKADGTILKMLQNGKETQVPKDKFEIDEQEVTTVTVPAGTFDCVHITGHSKDVKKADIWANPAATVMEGTLKQVMTTQMGIDMTLELQKFKKTQ